MLLITDRLDGNPELAGRLGLLQPCSVLVLGGAPAQMKDAAPPIIVGDVDLDRRDSVEAIRTALASHRPKGRPFLQLLREVTVRSTIQARAIGATEVLPVQGSAAKLVKTIERLLREEGASEPARGSLAFTRAHLTTAAASLADMLTSAAKGDPVPLRSVAASVEAIDQVAASCDIGSLLQVVWSYDDRTYQHCMLVAGLAANFGHRLGFSAADRQTVIRAAVLHDVGKARIPLAILHKPAALDDDEQAVMRSHPTIGYDMLVGQGGVPQDVLAAVRSHHEYLDGSGYPDGLAGAQIGDVVRIITICDIYAALIERRSYKSAMAPDEAYRMLEGMAGKLDMDLVRVFGDVVFGTPEAA